MVLLLLLLLQQLLLGLQLGICHVMVMHCCFDLGTCGHANSKRERPSLHLLDVIIMRHHSNMCCRHVACPIHVQQYKS
jgi:hypothetical protein